MNRKLEDARVDNLEKNSKAMENFAEIAFLLVVHNSGTSMERSLSQPEQGKEKSRFNFVIDTPGTDLRDIMPQGAIGICVT